MKSLESRTKLNSKKLSRKNCKPLPVRDLLMKIQVTVISNNGRDTIMSEAQEIVHIIRILLAT